MREPRWIVNQRAKENAKQQMFDAWDAIERFRCNGDTRGFSTLRFYLDDFVHRPRPEDQVFRISGWGILDERVTREEYDRMRAAWLQTEAGKSYPYKFDHGWETPTAKIMPAAPAEPGKE